MTGFLSRFLARCEAAPGHVQFTLVERGACRPLTNAALMEGAGRFAALFHARGAKPGDVVLIALRTGADLYGAFLGALWLGCVPAMMPFPSAKQDPASFWRSHDTLFRHLGGGLIVTFPENAGDVAANTTPGLMQAVSPQDATGAHDGPFHDWRPTDAVCLQHSSGTTGLKKGVILTLDMIERQIVAYTAASGLQPGDTIATWLPLYHDMGFIMNLVLPLGTGNHVVAMSPFEWLADPLGLFDMIERFDARFTWLPNFAFNHLARSVDHGRRRDLSGMKAFVNCSEPCKPDTFRLFEAAFADWGVRPDQMQASYGMAETVFAVTQTVPGRPPGAVAVPQSVMGDGGRIAIAGQDGDRVSSVGPPIPGMEVRIDGDGIGEILVRSAFLFAGYHRQPRADVFVDGWYRTGDIGFLRDGEVYVLGRKRDLIVSLGRNFFAHDLEALINDVPGVKPGRCVALGVFNPEIGSEDVVIVAELAQADRTHAIRSDIRARLQDTLALVPKRILLVEQGWLVKSTSGKISRGENLNKYNSMMLAEEFV